jgi:hypothetical protein
MGIRVARGGRTTTHARPRQTTATTEPPKGTATPSLYTGTCPVCGEADRLKVERREGVGLRSGWRVFCRRAECEGLSPGDWLREVATTVNAPYASAILEDPLRWLSDYLEAERPQTLAEPPTSADIDGYASGLLTLPDQVAYLRHERGLTTDTIRRARLGWDRNAGAFVFPVFNEAGEPVNLVRRPWPGEHTPKYRTMAGRTKANSGVELYPYPLPEGSWLLVEGVLDALLLRQQGVRAAVTSTHGVSTFLDEWLPLVKGRRIAVAFDVGVEQLQRQRVAALRAAGAEAWGVNIATLGLSDKEDLSDYMLSGGSADELHWFIKQERRRAR